MNDRPEGENLTIIPPQALEQGAKLSNHPAEERCVDNAMDMAESDELVEIVADAAELSADEQLVGDLASRPRQNAPRIEQAAPGKWPKPHPGRRSARRSRMVLTEREVELQWVIAPFGKLGSAHSSSWMAERMRP